MTAVSKVGLKTTFLLDSSSTLFIGSASNQVEKERKNCVLAGQFSVETSLV